MANIREAVELYVEDCIAAGDPVPNEAGKEFVELQVPKQWPSSRPTYPARTFEGLYSVSVLLIPVSVEAT